jgi:5-methylcytosine-specific restriction protein A
MLSDTKYGRAMTAKPCLRCRAITTQGSWCAQCRPVHERQRDKERNRGTPAERGYTSAWFRVAAAAIKAQPWCSRCYAVTNLTGDHIVPLSRGGTNDPSNVRVLCRKCNSSLGNR